MNASEPTRRSKYFIDRKAQGALASRIGMHWLLFLSLTLFLNVALRLVSNVENASLSDVVLLVAREQSVATLVLLALVPWFINDSIKLSHRLVGPVIRIRGAIRQLCAEDEAVQPVVLRQRDYFAEAARDFNQLQVKVLLERAELKRFRERESMACQEDWDRTIEIDVPLVPTMENMVEIPLPEPVHC